MNMRKSTLLLGAAALVVIALIVLVRRPVTLEADLSDAKPRPEAAVSEPERKLPAAKSRSAAMPARPADPVPEVVETAAAESADEESSADAERKVDAFDALTDRWMEESSAGRTVSIKDVDGFLAKFRAVPGARKEECLQRACNLIPDQNVMLLVGVLMDKSQPHELVELVFNDILNRDESVKQPILKQVFQDKTHPCWADTAWILDVTGQNQ